MPRDGSDVYSKPANTAAVSGQAISSSKYNQTIDDIVSDLNLARPIVAGGTGETTASAALTALGGLPLAGGAITGALTVGTTLGVTGVVTASSNMSVTGTVTATGQVIANGGIDATGNIDLTGATITSDITVTGDILSESAGSAEWRLKKNASGNLSRIWGQVQESGRWAMDLGDSTAESGSNVGSDFTLKAYDDSSSFLSNSLIIRRSNSQALFWGEITLVNDEPIAWNSGPRIQTGSGTPEGSLSANVGSLYLRTDGGSGTSLYVKESGSGNTGWVAK